MNISALAEKTEVREEKASPVESGKLHPLKTSTAGHDTRAGKGTQGKEQKFWHQLAWVRGRLVTLSKGFDLAHLQIQPEPFPFSIKMAP